MRLKIRVFVYLKKKFIIFILPVLLLLLLSPHIWCNAVSFQLLLSCHKYRYIHVNKCVCVFLGVCGYANIESSVSTYCTNVHMYMELHKYFPGYGFVLVTVYVNKITFFLSTGVQAKKNETFRFYVVSFK